MLIRDKTLSLYFDGCYALLVAAAKDMLICHYARRDARAMLTPYALMLLRAAASSPLLLDDVIARRRQLPRGICCARHHCRRRHAAMIFLCRAMMLILIFTPPRYFDACTPLVATPLLILLSDAIDAAAAAP